MSTRCNIIVTKTSAYPDSNGFPNPNNGLKKSQLYKSHDGYPTGVGLDLACRIIAMNLTPDDLDTHHKVHKDFVEQLPREYEIELGTYFDQKASLHGDIDYIYHLDFNNGIRLTAYKRPGYETPVPSDDSWRAWPQTELLRVSIEKIGPKAGWVIRHVTISNTPTYKQLPLDEHAAG